MASATTSTTDDLELSYDYRVRVSSRLVNPREFSPREQQQRRSRFASRRAPKCQTGGGTHQRRNKKHGL